MKKVLLASAAAILLASTSGAFAADYTIGVEGFKAIASFNEERIDDAGFMPSVFAEIEHNKRFVPDVRLKHYSYNDEMVEYTTQDLTLTHTIKSQFLAGAKIGAGITRISGINVLNVDGDDEIAPHLFVDLTGESKHPINVVAQAQVMRNSTIAGYQMTIGLRYELKVASDAIGMTVGYRRESMTFDGVFYDERVKSSARGLILGADYRF